MLCLVYKEWYPAQTRKLREKKQEESFAFLYNT
jgi:hypothetical protein